MTRRTYILNSTIVHEARTKVAHGYATRCNTLIPDTAQFVKVEVKAGVRMPVRGWLCGAGCFETKKVSLR